MKVPDLFLRHRHTTVEDRPEALQREQPLVAELHNDIHVIRLRQMELERRLQIVEARTESVRRLVERDNETTQGEVDAPGDT